MVYSPRAGSVRAWRRLAHDLGRNTHKSLLVCSTQIISSFGIAASRLPLFPSACDAAIQRCGV